MTLNIGGSFRGLLVLIQLNKRRIVMLEWFKCPDNQIIPIKDCLAKCRMDERCLTLPTLTLMAQEREWKGQASTTQLLNGTMLEFLKLTQPYVVDPDKRAFALLGTRHHQNLAEIAKQLGLPAEIPLHVDRDIFDLLEPDETGFALTDMKTWGSYKVAKALGIVEVGKKPHPTEIYKRSGSWGQAGTPKMITIFQAMPQEADLFNEELQLNRYRIMLDELDIQISRMQLQITVRDGGLDVASRRGITRNIYRIPIRRLDDNYVGSYFNTKQEALKAALKDGKWNEPCNDRECWGGARCRGYCEVFMFCPKGILAKQEDE